MKKIGVITNETKDPKSVYTNQILNELERCGIEGFKVKKVLGRVKADQAVRGHVDIRSLPEDVDALIVLGGDGTLLRAARDTYGTGIPLFGINIGTLGYLTEVEINQSMEAIKRLREDDCFPESRLMLKGSCGKSNPTGYVGEDVALNDVVIGRVGQIRLIELELYVNNKLLHKYLADGLIISTPTGSTAYNMSAGGPVVSPTAEMIRVTPICPAQLGTSSIVLSADDVLEIVVGEARKQEGNYVGASFDGEHLYDLGSGDRIRIEKADNSMNLVRLNETGFLDTLYHKMK